MKKFLLGAVIAASLIVPAIAKNFAVPSKNPAITVVVPDKWKTEEIEFGYSARSPDEDVFFSIESATVKKIDALFDNNTKWMKENKINDKVKPIKNEMNFNGVQGEVHTFNTTDANGPTIVDFVLLPGGKNTMILITLWGSDEERKANGKDIDAIMNSIKPIQ